MTRRCGLLAAATIGLAVACKGPEGQVQVVPRELPTPSAVVTPMSPAVSAPASQTSTPQGMVRVPAGTFTMGESSAARTVVVTGFWLDVTEVTADAYAGCVRLGRCSAEQLDCGTGSQLATYQASGKGNHPINCVDFGQASAYCASLGRRLPTQEEWEWAARGTSRGTDYPWGNVPPDGSELCWARNDGTCATGSFSAGDSPQGAKDLAANVSEWTSSARGADRVYRGGNWADDNAFYVRARTWRSDVPSYRDVGLGFRCAHSL